MSQKSVNSVIVIALFILITPFVSASFVNYAFDSITGLYDSFYGWLDFFILYLIFTSGIQLFLPKEWEEKKGSSGLVLGLGLAMSLGLTTWAHFNNFRLMDLGPFILILVVIGLLIRAYKFVTGGEKEKKLSLPLLLIGLIILILLLAMLVPGFIDSIPYLRDGLGILMALAILGLLLWLLSKLFKKGDGGKSSKPNDKKEKSKTSDPNKATNLRCWIELKKNRFDITEKIDIQGRAIPGNRRCLYTWTLYKKRLLKDKKIAYQEGTEKLEIFPHFLESFQSEASATYEVILVVTDQTDSSSKAKEKFVVFRTTTPTPETTPSTSPKADPLKCNIILPKKRFDITEEINIDSTVTGGKTPYKYTWKIYQKKTVLDQKIEEITGTEKLNLTANYFDRYQTSLTKKYEIILTVTDADSKKNTTKEIFEVTKKTSAPGTTPSTSPTGNASIKIINITVNKKSQDTETDETYSIDINSKLFIKVEYDNPNKEGKTILMDYTTKGRPKAVRDTSNAKEGQNNTAFILKIENERGYKGSLILALVNKDNNIIAQDRIYIFVEHPTMKGKVRIIGQLKKVGTTSSSPHKIKSREKIKFKAKIK